jgi:hypothetical protein
MSTLIRLALAAAGDGPRVRRTTARFACAALTRVVAGGCAVAALACGLAALWICVLPHVGAAGAAAIVAGVLLALCLALLALVRYGLKPRPTPPVGAGVLLLLAEAARLVRDNKGPTLLAALVAGFVAGKGEK